MNELANKSVLIVDDDRGMLRALERTLEHAGMKVSHASRARDGIQKLRDHPGPFDVVITDLRLPVASGLMIMHAVKTAFPNVPVILISAYTRSDMVADDWERLGAAAFLEKPINASNLLVTVRRVLSERSPITEAGHLTE